MHYVRNQKMCFHSLANLQSGMLRESVRHNKTSLIIKKGSKNNFAGDADMVNVMKFK